MRAKKLYLSIFLVLAMAFMMALKNARAFMQGGIEQHSSPDTSMSLKK